MKIEERIGSNIRSLRKAFGESQEKIAEILNISKSAISFYENGQRMPTIDNLTAIANHFMVSLEELVNSDFSGSRHIDADPYDFFYNIDNILPIVLSDTAIENDHFKKAYDAHREFYGNLRKNAKYVIFHINLYVDQFISICDEYLAAFDDKKSKLEAAINLIATLDFMLILFKAGSLAILDHSIARYLLAEKDPKVKKLFDDAGPDISKNAQEILSELADQNIEEFLNECKALVKTSQKWSDISYYYIALEYIFGIVRNKNDWRFNQAIGMEMMESFALVENKYAERFLKYIQHSLE